MRLIIYLPLIFINSFLYAQNSAFDLCDVLLPSDPPGVASLHHTLQTDDSSQIRELNVDSNYRNYGDMKEFKNPEAWVATVVRAAIQSYKFSYKILGRGYNSCDSETPQIKFWTLFIMHNITQKRQIAKIGYWNLEKESEGVKLLHFQKELLRRGFSFNKYFHPINEVFFIA